MLATGSACTSPQDKTVLPTGNTSRSDCRAKNFKDSPGCDWILLIVFKPLWLDPQRLPDGDSFIRLGQAEKWLS